MSVAMVTNPEWGECRQETGRGVLQKVEGEGRNRQVFIRATHTDLREDVTGWLDTQHTDLAQLLMDAQGRELEYEILVHRRRTIDAKPFKELGNREKVREVTKLAPVEVRDQMATSKSDSASGHDDAPGGGTPIHSDLDSHAPAERATSSGGVSYQWPVANTDTARFEGYGFLAACSMVSLAYQELHDALEGGELDEIKPALLQEVAQHLLNAADQAQRYVVGRTDRNAMSHTRARGLVHSALVKHPLDGGVHHLDTWAAEVTKTTIRLLAIAAKL